MTDGFRSILNKSLQAATTENDFGPWKMRLATAVGGACALRFDKRSETLLVATESGQSVFDCGSGERIFRDRDENGYCPQKLSGQRLDDTSAEPMQMSGSNGGGLLTTTPDGWRIDTLQIDWPKTYCILQPPDASIYFLKEIWRGRGKNSTYYLLRSGMEAPVAFGFSWTGRSLVWCDRSDLVIWARTNEC